jgi:hypothetical protein
MGWGGHGTVPDGGSKMIWICSNGFKYNLNLIRSKMYLLKFKKIEVKYGCEGFDERNNFHYRNFSKFKREIGIKT